jgi:hypothetical protein
MVASKRFARSIRSSAGELCLINRLLEKLAMTEPSVIRHRKSPDLTTKPFAGTPDDIDGWPL